MERRTFLKGILGLAGIAAVPAMAKGNTDKHPPIEYLDGMKMRFTPKHSNTGASNYRAEEFASWEALTPYELGDIVHYKGSKYVVGQRNG